MGLRQGERVTPGDNFLAYSVSLIALPMKYRAASLVRQLVHHDIWDQDLSVSSVL